MLAEGKPLQLIDTRPKHFVSRQLDIAEGVTWRDPERVKEWLGLPADETSSVIDFTFVAPRGTPGLLAVTFQTPEGLVTV